MRKCILGLTGGLIMLGSRCGHGEGSQGLMRGQETQQVRQAACTLPRSLYFTLKVGRSQ